MSTSRINLKCSRCGSDKFLMPSNPQPDDTISCAKCGASGRYGDMQQQSIKLVKKTIEEEFKKIFKRR